MTNPYAAQDPNYIDFHLTGFVSSALGGKLGGSLAAALFAEILKLGDNFFTLP